MTRDNRPIIARLSDACDLNVSADVRESLVAETHQLLKETLRDLSLALDCTLTRSAEQVLERAVARIEIGYIR